MNEQTSQVELKNIIAQKTNLPFDTIDAFVDQLFIEVRKNIVDDSFFNLEGLGLFRVIKGANSNRILFLGKKQPPSEAIDVIKLKKEIDRSSDKIDVTAENLNDENLFFEESPQNIIFEEKLEIVENESSDTYLEDFPENNNLLYMPPKKRKFSIGKVSIIILLLAIVAIVVVVLGIQNRKESIEYKTKFVEIENTDPANFSYIIIPESDVSLEFVSKTYYGVGDFWPYIYNANEDFVDNHLLIQGGSIIKIPKIMIDLVDYQNGTTLANVKKLGDQIREESNNN